MAMLKLDIKEHYKDQLLSTLFYYMGQDLRHKLMVECPTAYNAACDSEGLRPGRDERATGPTTRHCKGSLK